MTQFQITPAPEVVQALTDLKARYFRLIDTKQWGPLQDVFAVEAVFDGLWSAATSPEKFVANLERNLGPAVISVHQGFTAEFREVEAGRVRGIWAMHDYVLWPPGGKPYMGVTVPGQSGMSGYGFYEEEYRLVGGEWKISYMRLTRLLIEPVVNRPETPAYPVLPPSTDWLVSTPR